MTLLASWPRDQAATRWRVQLRPFATGHSPFSFHAVPVKHIGNRTWINYEVTDLVVWEPCSPSLSRRRAIFPFQKHNKFILQGKSFTQATDLCCFSGTSGSPLVGVWLCTFGSVWSATMLEGINPAVASLSALVCSKESQEHHQSATEWPGLHMSLQIVRVQYVMWGSCALYWDLGAWITGSQLSPQMRSGSPCPHEEPAGVCRGCTDHKQHHACLIWQQVSNDVRMFILIPAWCSLGVLHRGCQTHSGGGGSKHFLDD